MSYILKSLGQSEDLLYRARFPWFYQIGGWAVLLGSVAAGITALLSGYGGLGAASVLAGVAALLAVMIPIWTTEIGVTTQRLIYKRGLLWRSTQELQLRAIEEVNLEQGLAGRILDYGRLEIRGTGVDDMRLPALADPLALRKALQDGMASASQLGTLVPPAPVSLPAG